MVVNSAGYPAFADRPAAVALANAGHGGAVVPPIALIAPAAMTWVASVAAAAIRARRLSLLGLARL